MNTEPCIDVAALDKLSELGGIKFVGEMITLFSSFIPGKITEACDAGKAQDWKAVGRAVHPIRSSARHLGAQRVTALATQIEQLTGDGEADAINDLLRELRVAYAQAEQRLTEWLAGLEQQ